MTVKKATASEQHDGQARAHEAEALDEEHGAEDPEEKEYLQALDAEASREEQRRDQEKGRGVGARFL